jgi:hypothetical protein
VHGLATWRTKGRTLSAPAFLVRHIHIPSHAAPAAPERALGARGGKRRLFFAAGGAHLVFQVDIPRDSATRAVHYLSTWRTKRRHLATTAHLVLHIHITRHAAPAAPERALGAKGGKGGLFFAACRAHLIHQVDIPLDPAPRAVHGLATARTKRRLLAAPALLVHHIHIPSHAAPAAPEWLLGASTCEGGVFFAANCALAWHVFFFYFFFYCV